jgi:hypothetical protein
MVRQLQQQLAQQRTKPAHVDATMRLFDPDMRPQKIRPRQQRARSAWHRQANALGGSMTSCVMHPIR